MTAGHDTHAHQGAGALAAGVPLALLAVLVLAYVMLAYARSTEPRGWNPRRTTAFVAGAVLLGPGVASAAHAIIPQLLYAGPIPPGHRRARTCLSPPGPLRPMLPGRVRAYRGCGMTEDVRYRRRERMDGETEPAVVADRKPRPGNRFKRVPVRMATSGDLLPQQGQDILGPGKDHVFGADMLIKGQYTARPQDPAHLSKSRGLVDDTAQNKAGDHRVGAGIGSRDSLRGPRNDGDRNRNRRCLVYGQGAQIVIRLHRQDLRDRGGIQRER